MFFIMKIVFLLVQIAIELKPVSSLQMQGIGVCCSQSKNETKDLYCCQGYKENRKDDKCEACPLGTYGINCSKTCMEGFYGVRCNSSCNCSNEMFRCDKKKGCTLNVNEGLETKIQYGIIIGLVIILLLTLAITIPFVLWRTGGIMPFFRMIINRSRQCFQNNPSSFEMTTDENFYAAIRVSAVLDTYIPTAIQMQCIPYDDQHNIFRLGNLTTRSKAHIYSVAKPIRNTSILDHDTSKTRTTLVCPESVVHTTNDTSQENKKGVNVINHCCL